MGIDEHDHTPTDTACDGESTDGARGRGTEHGLKGKLKQGFNAVTGRDLDTASTAEVETTGEAGGGGTDGRS